MEDENNKLHKMVADLSMDKEMRQAVLGVVAFYLPPLA